MNRFFRALAPFAGFLEVACCLALARSSIAATASGTSKEVATVTAPGGRVEASLLLQQGECAYSVRFNGGAVVTRSAAVLVTDPPMDGGFELVGSDRVSADSVWRPVYGESAEVPERFQGVVAHLRERGVRGRLLDLELRAYPEGVALRFALPSQPGEQSWRIAEEKVEFRFPQGAAGFPIHYGEQLFSNQPVEISKIKPGAHTPLTVSLPHAFASVLEAFVVDYPRICLGKTGDQALVTALRGSATVRAPFSMPWRVVLLAENEAGLITAEHLVPLLNPPSAIADPGWIKVGLTISNEGGAALETEPLKKLVDFGSKNGFRHLQLDWGWYGTEVAWSKEQVEFFRKIVPAKLRDSGWEENTRANPFTVAKGYVPYRPEERWKNFGVTVNLDVPELARYARERGMGVGLYVEASQTLYHADLDNLFATYAKWGITGIKPGFVRYGRQADTAWIRKLVETAARHHLTLCIHDAYVPEGITRTWPNLVIVEGGGGQEQNYPAVQDVMLPFTRGLAGPFDYTPTLYTKGRSHAHMLGMLVAYHMPTPVVRGGFDPWLHPVGAAAGGEELEFLRTMPTTWDETRVLDANIGHHLVTARRSGEKWFLGGLTGSEGCDLKLPLAFLDARRTYKAFVVTDNTSAAKDGWCPAQSEKRNVTASDTLSISMAPAGGVAIRFEPVAGR